MSFRPAKMPRAMAGMRSAVQKQRAAVDEPEMHAERDFEDIDDEKEPRAGADELVFRQVDGEEVERHDGAGGVGEHGGDAAPAAHEPGKAAGVRQRSKRAGRPAAQGLQHDHREDDPADDRPKARGRDEPHEQVASEDTGDGGREHAPDRAPSARAGGRRGPHRMSPAMSMRQEDAGRFPRRKEPRHDDDGDQAERRRSRFWKSRCKTRRAGEQPFARVKGGSIGTARDSIAGEDGKPACDALAGAKRHHTPKKIQPPATEWLRRADVPPRTIF